MLGLHLFLDIVSACILGWLGTHYQMRLASNSLSSTRLCLLSAAGVKATATVAGSVTFFMY